MNTIAIGPPAGRDGSPNPNPPEHRYILGVRVDGTSYRDAVTRVVGWALRHESRYVCVATVHTVMVAHDGAPFRRLINDADLVTPDGMPLVWGLRLLGVKHATRVYGPDLAPDILRVAATNGIAVGFYGGSPQVLPSLVEVLKRRFPALKVTFAKSPPFGRLTLEEDRTDVEEMNRAGVRILFVGLGCPKQEGWMAWHAGRVRAVLVGVGAAFDFLAGAKPQAPRWMQRAGLEWLFRLGCEPRRLWRRYLLQGPRFVGLFVLQRLGMRHFEELSPTEHRVHDV